MPFGLCTVLAVCNLLRGKKAVHILENIFCITVACYSVKKALAEGLFNILTDDEYNLSKAAFHCVISCKVQKAFVVKAYSVYLFYATIAASHSGCKYK